MAKIIFVTAGSKPGQNHRFGTMPAGLMSAPRHSAGAKEEFRLRGTEVKIRKEGEKVILEPIEKTKWPDGFWDLFRPDPAFEIPKPMPSKEFSLD
jgi:virulence-associated protein VagC